MIVLHIEAEYYLHGFTRPYKRLSVKSRYLIGSRETVKRTILSGSRDRFYSVDESYGVPLSRCLNLYGFAHDWKLVPPAFGDEDATRDDFPLTASTIDQVYEVRRVKGRLHNNIVPYTVDDTAYLLTFSVNERNFRTKPRWRVLPLYGPALVADLVTFPLQYLYVRYGGGYA